MISTCCGCASLKKGVLIVSILQFVLSIINLVIECYQHQGLLIGFSYFIILVVSSLAIRGAVNENAHLIFPLLSVYFVGFLMILPFAFIRMIQQANQVSAPGQAYARIILGTIFGFGIGVHIFIVIYSFHQELLRKKFSSSNSNNTVANVEPHLFLSINNRTLSATVEFFSFLSAMIELSSFCGRISLKKGVLFISILHFILSFSGLMYAAIKLYQSEVMVVLLISFILSILAIIGTVTV
ncbi:hypothetical protein PV327_001986 [Microctonus hyperodae]|uniref:Uncharacterized protein n=1 Tax=Microctonus hyperodae TaxID=165561 RepID=A0AA39KNL6_MICHY|nr:hypothetical protein PV327_001986 [Microctonus hyperodae]